MSAEYYCSNVITMNPVDIGHKLVGSVILATGIIYLVTAIILIFFIEKKVKDAQNGQETAQKAVIFPLYVQILWVVVLTNIYVCVLTMVFNYGTDMQELSISSVWALGVMKAIQHFVSEGVAFLLMRKGLGMYAAVKTLKLAVLWFFVTLFVKAFVYYCRYKYSTTPGANALNFIYNIVILLFYLLVWLMPDHKLFRRPAAKSYARFWVFYRVVSLFTDIFGFFPATSATSLCMNVFVVFLLLGIMQPYVVYVCLLQDCLWWQGIGSGNSSPISMLSGIDINSEAAMKLAERMDSISNQSQNKSVKLLNFAYITMDRKEMLGAGSFSKVYRGTYRSEPCAVKLIFTVDLTVDVINRVAAEAQLLSKIQDPNIVKIFGVSVLPPSVCILLELCAFGSLADLCQGTVGTPSGNLVGKAQAMLHDADKLFMALGCAKGLAALHSYGPDLVHRDIKSFNFLVDHQLNCKLADLELGSDANRAKRRSMKTSGNDFGSSIVSSFNVNKKPENSDLESGVQLNADEILPNWVAPEVLQGGNHNQASDVYAFGLVLWEIISGLNPYYAVKKRDAIRSLILAGVKPDIPPIYFDPTTVQYRRYKEYIALIDMCWQFTPQARPSADIIVSELANIYRLAVCGNLVYDTSIKPDLSSEDLTLAAKTTERSSSHSSIGSPLWSKVEASSDDIALSISKQEFSSKVSKVIRDPVYKAFDGDASAWIVVTAQYPHLVMRVSNAWKTYTGNDSQNYFSPDLADNVFGLPLKSVMTGAETETKTLNEFIGSLSAENFVTSHCLLTLYKDIDRDEVQSNAAAGLNLNPSTADPGLFADNRRSSTGIRKSRSDNASSTTNNDGMIDVFQCFSLFSLHAFPIKLNCLQEETTEDKVSSSNSASGGGSGLSDDADVNGKQDGGLHFSLSASSSYSEGSNMINSSFIGSLVNDSNLLSSSPSLPSKPMKESFGKTILKQSSGKKLGARKGDVSSSSKAAIAIIFSEFKETSEIAYQRRAASTRSSISSVASSVLSSATNVLADAFVNPSSSSNSNNDISSRNSGRRSVSTRGSKISSERPSTATSRFSAGGFKSRFSESSPTASSSTRTSSVKLEGIYRTNITSTSEVKTDHEEAEIRSPL